MLGGVLLTALGAAAFGAFFLRAQEASAVGDPRQDAPLVRLAMPVPAAESDRRFTGAVAARVQSNLGFRVPGKSSGALSMWSNAPVQLLWKQTRAASISAECALPARAGTSHR